MTYMSAVQTQYPILKASISIQSEFDTIHKIDEIILKCPECGSTQVRPNGTRKRDNTRVDAYICRNPKCPSQKRKYPRQFVVYTSGTVQELINRDIENMIYQLYIKGAKGKTIANQHGVSEAMVSFLRDEVDQVIEHGFARDKLVADLVHDTAIAIDETFFKIKGKPIYAIIIRGYQSKKVLGINVTTSRKEADMQKAFNEAQQNTHDRISTITSDAWGATQTLTRNLGYPVTHIVHKHKKPYDKAVIFRIEYEGTDRITTKIGVKTDVFTKKATREFRYFQRRESLITPLTKPRGRPKGSKTKKKGRKKRLPHQ